MNTIIDKLSSALNRRDEIPNQELAADIVKNKDKKAVAELIENLSNKNTRIQNDCIKVVYEIGELNPVMISDYIPNFIKLLDSKNNRMVWGAMSALNRIVLINPNPVYLSLAKICETADNGTVITKDQAVSILTKLCTLNEYNETAFPLLIEQLLTCPTNQLPMYAENAIPIITNENKGVFIKTLTTRLVEIEKDTKRNRVEKVIKKVQNKK